MPAQSEQHLPVRSNLEKEVSNIFYEFESRLLNPWATVGSLAFASVFLLALIAIPLFHIDPLPKRETLTMLYLPPPAAAGGNPTKFQSPPKLKFTRTPSMVIPAPMHITPAAPSAVNATDDVLGGVPGGVAGGIPGGADMLGGLRSMALPPRASEPTQVKRRRVASSVAEANLIHDVPPQYPPEAGRERIEGTVVLLAVIGSDGSVQDVQVISGLPMLAEAAIEAVKQWRYKPYLLNGIPVEIDSRITINFTLSRG